MINELRNVIVLSDSEFQEIRESGIITENADLLYFLNFLPKRPESLSASQKEIWIFNMTNWLATLFDENINDLRIRQKYLWAVNYFHHTMNILERSDIRVPFNAKNSKLSEKMKLVAQ